ncbi:uncharacterized protein LOC124778994 [Schistocerca piceifrons]|uniref:uncharacterized protein LOC124778994 n=1 Tax=Schistocerca piceifrons TaxID=274613 RepID=UPI001F5E9165|nr:uncharacterized protein LOC124778994 [Schistocerca piceifrons]
MCETFTGAAADGGRYRLKTAAVGPFGALSITTVVSRSNEHQVTLTNVGRDLTGYYKCEVSADAPLFHTVIKTALMIVADLPTDDPVVDVEKLKYSLGEKIRANCTVEPSYPAANLSWYINGKLLMPGASASRIETTSVADATGLETARSTLELEAAAPLFVEGRLRLRCLATVFTLFRKSQELVLAEDTPQLAPVMGPTAPHSLDDAASRAASSSSETTLSVLGCVFIAAVATR